MLFDMVGNDFWVLIYLNELVMVGFDKIDSFEGFLFWNIFNVIDNILVFFYFYYMIDVVFNIFVFD